MTYDNDSQVGVGLVVVVAMISFTEDREQCYTSVVHNFVNTSYNLGKTQDQGVNIYNL